jgi:hypothetical protein
MLIWSPYSDPVQGWSPYGFGADIHQAHQQAAGPANALFSPGGQASVLAVQAGDGNQVRTNPTIG